MKFHEIINNSYPEKPLYINEKSTLLYKDVLAPVFTNDSGVVKIIEENPSEQLRKAYTLASGIPFIVPENLVNEKISVPYPDADFAVATSGTSKGKSKYYFRTVKSWSDFFPIQNKLFGISKNSVVFVQGSMCYTGNFNMMTGIASAGATAVSSLSLRPEKWAETIISRNADVVYLVPEKLLHLCKSRTVFENIKTVICGSQLVSRADFSTIKQSFPNARLILYYGSSEVSYVTYNIFTEEPDSDDCVGKLFEGVDAFIADNGHIMVKTPFAVCGADSPCDTGDLGYFDKEKALHFLGRA